MPPVAITFHTSSAHSRPSHRIAPTAVASSNQAKTSNTRPLTFYTISSHPYASNHPPDRVTVPLSFKEEKAPAGQTDPSSTRGAARQGKATTKGEIPSPGGASSASTSSSTTRPSSRRKPVAHRAPSAFTSGIPSQSGSIIPSVTLTPLIGSILTRCLLTDPNASATRSTPSKSASSLVQRNSRQPVAPIHPYSRMTDLGNDRSANPSPREILRAQKAEEERSQMKKDSIASARAAMAGKKRKGKSSATTRAGSRSKDSAGVTRSPSPADPPAGGAATTKDVPVITTHPASIESSPAAQTLTLLSGSNLPVSKSLKRTRSAGLAPLSTTAANALGYSNTGTQSPLRSVTGPEEYVDDKDEEMRQAKKSRTTSGGRKASSLSPHSDKANLPPVGTDSRVPKSLPVAPGRLVPSTRGSRQSTRATSIAVDGLNAPAASASVGTSPPNAMSGTLPSNLAPGVSGGTGMRRVVSSAGAIAGGAGSASIGAGNGASRRGSSGSQGSEGVANMRSRREVNLPRALRDYEMRAGTAV